jgi:hypothetical protein
MNHFHSYTSILTSFPHAQPEKRLNPNDRLNPNAIQATQDFKRLKGVQKSSKLFNIDSHYISEALVASKHYLGLITLHKA